MLVLNLLEPTPDAVLDVISGCCEAVILKEELVELVDEVTLPGPALVLLEPGWVLRPELDLLAPLAHSCSSVDAVSCEEEEANPHEGCDFS